LYVLNSQGKPVPRGVAGELCIGGFALARGYLNNAEITAEKFVPDPFSQQEGERLYRTGDLVRYQQDGIIEFLGRIDHQVKIRGFRIELGEIETSMQKNDAVERAVVIAFENGRLDKTLVAYFSCEKELQVTADELKQQISGQLPDYMVPAMFVQIDNWPMTPTGKIDRRKLPEPDFAGRQVKTEFVAPRTETEQKLAKIVAEVLEIEKVGIHDNFFELGGHSMLGTRVISQIREDFSVELPLKALFENPTVDGIAQAMTLEEAAFQDSAELEDMLSELEGLSEEDVKRLLEE